MSGSAREGVLDLCIEPPRARRFVSGARTKCRPRRRQTPAVPVPGAATRVVGSRSSRRVSSASRQAIIRDLW